MPPLSRFNPSYTAQSNYGRTSYDSHASHSSLDSHMSTMSTSSHHQDPLSQPTNQYHHHPPQPHYASQRESTRREEEKSLPLLPGNSVTQCPKNRVTFSEEKPLPECPEKHPHVAKLKNMGRGHKLKRTSSREGGYVWYAQNCKRIHDQCEAERMNM